MSAPAMPPSASGTLSVPDRIFCRRVALLPPSYLDALPGVINRIWKAHSATKCGQVGVWDDFGVLPS